VIASSVRRTAPKPLVAPRRRPVGVSHPVSPSG
jgi:hypothetical protein